MKVLYVCVCVCARACVCTAVKSFIANVLKRKARLKAKFKCVCVTMCS